MSRPEPARSAIATGQIINAAPPRLLRSRPARLFQRDAPPEPAPSPDNARRKCRDRLARAPSGSPDIEYLANLKALGQVYRDIFGAHYPAMALVQVVRLVEKAARVEIEATAVVPR